MKTLPLLLVIWAANGAHGTAEATNPQPPPTSNEAIAAAIAAGLLLAVIYALLTRYMERL